MKSVSFKLGIIAAFIILSRCGHDSPISTIHPLLILKEERVAILSEERVDTISRVIVTTTAAKDFSMYRIIDDKCTLTYPWSATTSDGFDSSFIASVAISNDPAAAQAGTFLGSWDVPDSLFKYGSIRIYVCVTDEENHDVCAALVVRGSTPLP
jgi:hypothetical protein